MKPIVEKCFSEWKDDDHCRLSSSEEGWGCRLMVCFPDRMPRTEAARKRLFHKVYTYAKECGVLECPYFRESLIDDVIDDPKRLTEIIRVAHHGRADLLSEDFSGICNKLKMN